MVLFQSFFFFFFFFQAFVHRPSLSFFSLCSFLLFEGLLFLLGEREKKAEVSGGDSEERGWREYKGPQKRLPAVT